MATEYKIFLPTIYKSPSRLGVVLTESALPQRTQFLVPGSLLQLWLTWANTERSLGVYTWSENLEAIAPTILQIYEFGFSIKNSPPFYRAGDKECEEPLPEYYQAYTDFVLAAINRYHPFWVEIWNEPDVYPYEVADPHVMGCWGRDYASGVRYGNMLKVLYPQVKQAYPNVTVLAGAMYYAQQDFWKGVAETAQDYFDAVSFHHYVQPNPTGWIYPKLAAQYLRTTTDKPIWWTETAVLYDNPTPENEQSQADFLKQAYYDLDNAGISRMFWLELAWNTWRNCEMVKYPDVKKPVWFIYQNLLGGLQ